MPGLWRGQPGGGDICKTVMLTQVESSTLRITRVLFIKMAHQEIILQAEAATLPHSPAT